MKEPIQAKRLSETSAGPKHRCTTDNERTYKDPLNHSASGDRSQQRRRCHRHTTGCHSAKRTVSRCVCARAVCRVHRVHIHKITHMAFNIYERFSFLFKYRTQCAR